MTIADAARIPRRLKQRRQWVCWTLEERDGITTKVPRRASDWREAATTRDRDWATYAEAVEAAKEHDAGIGFVFTADDPYCGIDFDHCVEDGVVDENVAGYLKALDSYAEISPSGSGIHAIVLAELGKGRRTGDTPWGGMFEVYDRGRFFTFTGDLVDESWEQPEERSDVLKRICDELLHGPGDTSSDDDEAILRRARAARNGAKFSALYDDGDISGYASASEADLALCSMLAYWLGPSPLRLNRVFRQSALMRDKWDRDDYAMATIDRALSTQTDFYSEDETETGFERKVDRRVRELEINEEARRRLRLRESAESFDRFGDVGWTLEDELALPDTDPMYRVKDLQPSGGNVLLVAAHKIGKSAMTLNLVRALVDDKPFLGRFKVEPLSGNVAIFNYEETPTQWRRHVRALGIKHPQRVIPVHLRGAGITPIWDPAWQDRVVEWMIAHEIQYWITDPTVVAWQGLVDNENDNALVAAYTSAIDQVKARAGITELLLTHHTGRLTETVRARGATRLEDWMDAGWYMDRDDDTSIRSLSAKGRDVEIEEFELEWRQDRWELIAGEPLETQRTHAQVQFDKRLRQAFEEILQDAHPNELSQSSVRDRLRAGGIKGDTNAINKKLQEYAATPKRPGPGMKREGQRILFYWRPKA